MHSNNILSYWEEFISVHVIMIIMRDTIHNSIYSFHRILKMKKSGFSVESPLLLVMWEIS